MKTLFPIRDKVIIIIHTPDTFTANDSKSLTKNPLADIEARIESIINNKAHSKWLKSLLLSALEKDCVDAANDSELLADVLKRRAELILESARYSQNIENNP